MWSLYIYRFFNFALNYDDGLAENILGEEIPNEFEESVNEASEACPVSAIEVE